jgi:hypothetical protein
MTSTAMLKGEKSYTTRMTTPLPGASVSSYDDILKQMEARLESDGVKGAMPVSTVAKQIVDAATAKNPPPVLWTGTGAWIFRYMWQFIPYWLQWKLWSGFGLVDQVKMPDEGELLVLGSK